jgi:DnaK suppressor protein
MTARKSTSKPGSAKAAQAKIRRAAASAAPAKARAAKQAAPAKAKPAPRAASRQKPAATRKTPAAKPALPRKATAKPVPTSQARKGKAAVKPPRSAASRLKSKPVSKTPSHVTTPSKNKTPTPSAKKAAAPKSGGKAETQANAKAKTKPVKGETFTHAELENYYQAMQEMRKRLLLQVSELRQQSLLRHDEVNQDEDGTDAFERVTSLDRASVEQAEIVQINAALMAIKEGTYGLCESCDSKIEKSRLKALPFAKTCIKCQSAMENQNSRRRSTHDLWD